MHCVSLGISYPDIFCYQTINQPITTLLKPIRITLKERINKYFVKISNRAGKIKIFFILLRKILNPGKSIPGNGLPGEESEKLTFAYIE